MWETYRKIKGWGKEEEVFFFRRRSPSFFSSFEYKFCNILREEAGSLGLDEVNLAAGEQGVQEQP